MKKKSSAFKKFTKSIGVSERNVSETSLLGFGFNICGMADISSGSTFAVVSGADDNVVTSSGDQETHIHAYTFNSREEVTEHFASSVDLSYSGMAFDGEFSAKYGSGSESDTQNFYGLYDVNRPSTITKLINMDSDSLSKGFAMSSDVLNLPTTFTPESAEQFYRIFRRFGTHVITEVTLGGRLSAYTTAQLSNTMNSHDASANIKLEYNALFYSTSAQSSTEWSKIDKNWSTEREITFAVIGGDPSHLASFTPDFGASGGDLISTWLGTVDATPGVVGFRLSPLSVVFDGPKATAVDKALESFLSSLLRVQTYELYSPMPLNGTINIPMASTITLPGQATQAQPSSFWGTKPSAVPPQWIWIALLNPDAPSFTDPNCLNKSYFLSTGFADVIDADIVKARTAIPNPLVIVCAEFEPYIPGGHVGTMIPGQLQGLVEECGFDLQAATDATSIHQIIALAGRANNVIDLCVVSSINDYVFEVPATAVVQSLNDTWEVVDQGGIVLSPLNS